MLKRLAKFWPLLILTGLAGLIVWPVFLPGYFSHHDDLQVMRIFEMRRCFTDLQLPCRWVPDMGFGNGFPLFNYYGVFPYYIGAALSFGLGYIGAAKVLFFIPLLFGGLAMYWLGKELFGKVPGLLAAILFLFAPYRALDSYVRGAIAESFAMALAPLLFYFFLRLVKQKTIGNLVGSVVTLAAFLTCHNLMTLLFTPLLIIWLIYWLFIYKWTNLKVIIGALLLGFGLAAFFLLPAAMEQNLVQTNTLTELGSDFRAHFTTLDELFFSRFWGYGASLFGPNDTISFQVGWPHWWLVVLSGLMVVGLWLKRKGRVDKQISLIALLLVVFGLSVFMTHDRSIFIWNLIPPLKYLQFPWRFLALSIFSASLLGGLVLAALKKRWQVLGLIVIGVGVICLNWMFFRPQDFYYSLTDQEKLSGKLFEIQQQAGILDYLPKTAQEPKAARPDRPEVISGSAQVSEFNDRSNSWDFRVLVGKSANLEIPVFDFPVWRVAVDGREFAHSHDNRLGRIRVDLPPGDYVVSGRLYNSPIRIIANSITVFSAIILIWLIIGRKRVFGRE